MKENHQIDVKLAILAFIPLSRKSNMIFVYTSYSSSSSNSLSNTNFCFLILFSDSMESGVASPEVQFGRKEKGKLYAAELAFSDLHKHKPWELNI